MSPLRRLFLSESVPPELRSNFTHYYFDIGWWGVYAGATAAFLTIYAARIGATPEQIGLLTALPALLSMLFSLPLGRLIQRLSAKRAAVIGAFAGRALLVSYALLPVLLPPEVQIWAILAAASVMTLPNTLVGIAFSQFFMEAVPAEWRGTVVGVRNALFAILSFSMTLASGQILDAVAFPLGYQVVFFIGFLGAVLTAYHIWRVKPLARPVPLAAPGLAALTGFRGLLPSPDDAGRRYLRVLGLLFVFNTINSMVNPLVPGILVNRLHLSDATIGFGTAATAMLQFIVSLFIARVTRRVGNPGGTGLGAALLAAQAVTLALASDAGLYLLSTLFGGIGTGLLLTAQFNYNLEHVPERERSTWLSWALLLSNAALLIGALAGPWLAGRVGLAAALVGLGVMRVLIGGVIWKRG